MSIFKIPSGVAAKVEQKMRNFLWEGFEGDKKTHPVNWKQVSRSKEGGGLGIGALKERNEALRGKWLWRFPMEPHSLWHKIIKSKYGLAPNGWDAKLTTTTSCRSPWRSISKGYPAFLQCCRFAPGNGEKIRFWEDYWRKEGVLKELFPRLFSLSTKRNQCISAFVITDDSSFDWDFSFRRNLTEAEIVEAISLLEILREVRVSNASADKRVWETEEGGTFSCKAFKHFLSSRTERQTFNSYNSVWKAKTPPKVKFLVWLAALGKTSTCEQIQKRNPRKCLSPSWCVLCRNSAEYNDHLFLHCPFTLNLWWKLLGVLEVTWVIPRNIGDLFGIIWKPTGRRRRAQTLWKCLSHAILWTVWLERNHRIFEDYKEASSEEVWERTKFWAALWASVSGHFKNYHYSVIMRDFSAVLR